jgi:serine/threonine protein kinase
MAPGRALHTRQEDYAGGCRISPKDVLKAGERLGDYEIVHPLRSGGMATLYRARRRGAAGFARDVAIKVVHPHLAANPAFLRMFVEEAHLAVRIHHPNVVQVEELGAEGGNLYLVMELIRGCSLAELMEALVTRGQRLPLLQTMRLGIQVAEGLHAAHETRDDSGTLLGVVHRDVTPQNVLVSEKGYAKVIDFGIAKAMGRDRTRTGTLKGTYAYMAPEQARALEVDRRSDVYALGVVLWELLTLRRLFDAASDAELLDRVREPVVEPPSRYARDIGPELDAAVLTALAPRPTDRPSTAEHFRRLLCEAMPAASTESPATLEQLVGELMPKRTPQLHTADEARAAVAGKAFRRGTDVTTLPPSSARAPVSTPADGVSMPRQPRLQVTSRPMRKHAVVTVLVIAAALTGGWVALRDKEPAAGTPPHAAAARVEARSPAAEPSIQRATPASPAQQPSLALPVTKEARPRTEGPRVRPRADERRALRATAPDGSRRSVTQTPKTRMIDGVLVLDEVPY